jgi:hypothetical protein
MQQQNVGDMRSPSEEEKDRTSPMGCRHNLDDAWIVIDGVRHNVMDLLRLVVQQLKK